MARVAMLMAVTVVEISMVQGLEVTVMAQWVNVTKVEVATVVRNMVSLTQTTRKNKQQN